MTKGSKVPHQPAQGMPVTVFVALAALLSGAPAAAQSTVRHPADGLGTIQAAVDAAGCGGTVLLAAGTYNERVIATCGLRLIGAGVGSTVLDGTGLVEPAISPVIGFGGSPFEFSQFTDGYELSDVTIRAGRNAPLLGVAVGWTRGVNLHDLAIEGFSQGIAIVTSSDGAIHDVFVRGPGANPHQFETARCITLIEFGLFLDRLPHMSGWRVDHNVLEDCAVGIDLQNNVDASIGYNTIQRTWIGMNLFGTGNADVHHNFIAHSDGPKALGFPPAGISLTNANGSSIHHNTLCGNRVGIRYDGIAPDAFGFPTSRDNRIHHNIFGGNKEDIAFNDPLLGPGNTQFDNSNDPVLDCSPLVRPR